MLKNLLLLSHSLRISLLFLKTSVWHFGDTLQSSGILTVFTNFGWLSGIPFSIGICWCGCKGFSQQGPYWELLVWSCSQSTWSMFWAPADTRYSCYSQCWLCSPRTEAVEMILVGNNFIWVIRYVLQLLKERFVLGIPIVYGSP